MRCVVAILSISVLVLACEARAERDDLPRLIQTIPLDGVEGRIDHMAADAKAERLYVAALGNSTLEVIDMNAGKQIGRIAGLKKPQGVVVAPDLNRVIVASG